MGDIIPLRKKPKQLQLGDRKENFNKKLEPIEWKKKEIEKLVNNIKKR
ncbi:hypothetical protein [Neobacillus notoginsengisoli]|nr:hypothetical protein [Neobacillus notoginsengisoli]